MRIYLTVKNLTFKKYIIYKIEKYERITVLLHYGTIIKYKWSPNYLKKDKSIYESISNITNINSE